MSDAAGAKALDLGRKLVSAERALAAIRAGSRIYVGTGCAAPRGLLAKLEAMVPGPPDLESASSQRQLCREWRALHILAIGIGRFSSAAKRAGWRAAANSTTCPSRWRRYRNFWRADGCRSTWHCFRFPRLMPGASSAS